MIFALILGMISANSSLADSYAFIHHYPIRLGIPSYRIEAPLINWINQGLLTAFFLLVGMHIKREMTSGALSSPGAAAVPAAAALGGMALPAVIYAGFNYLDPGALRGWAIPIATDVVLVLGLLSVFARYVAPGVVAFVTASAIFDDLGAVSVIALFYGEGEFGMPAVAISFGLVALIVLNRRRVAHFSPYLVAGSVLWVGMMLTGFEAAVAGAIVGLLLPLASFPPELASQTERRLSPLALFLVVPIFAYFNSGVELPSANLDLASDHVALGIIGALVIGKPAGVLIGIWFAIRLKLGSLPTGTNASDIIVVAPLAGVGFTMSLFIVTAAFDDPARADVAKLAVITGSGLAAVLAVVALKVRTSVKD